MLTCLNFRLCNAKGSELVLWEGQGADSIAVDQLQCLLQLRLLTPSRQSTIKVEIGLPKQARGKKHFFNPAPRRKHYINNLLKTILCDGQGLVTLGTEKTHHGQRRDRILRFFLCPEIGQFSPHSGAISLLNYTETPGERGKTSTGENSKTNPVETAPRDCRFLSLVMVERALIHTFYVMMPKISPSELSYVTADPMYHRELAKCNFLTRRDLHVKYAMS